MPVKAKWSLKVFLPLKVNEVDGIIMLLPTNPQFTKTRTKEIQGKPAGTSEGCIAVDVTLPTSPLLPSVTGVLLCVLVVVNEAILNTVMKKK